MLKLRKLWFVAIGELSAKLPSELVASYNIPADTFDDAVSMGKTIFKENYPKIEKFEVVDCHWVAYIAMPEQEPKAK